MKKWIASLLAALLLLTCIPCMAENAELANPWVDTDEEGFTSLTGLEIGMPEDAENVIWRVLEEEGLGEVQFTWQDVEYTARICSAAEFTDISGLNYDEWAVEDACTVGYCEGVAKRTFDGDMTVDLCQWFDVAPGVMYSVSVIAPDLDGFDILAAAELLFVPMQGDVG